MMRARQQPVRSFSLAGLGLEAAQLTPHGYRFVDIFQPRRPARVEFLQGSAEAIATALLGKIKEAL